MKWEEDKLIGKTIKSVKREKLEYEGQPYDDDCILILEMTDGSVFRIEADYGGYSGLSEGEYPRLLSVREVDYGN